VASLRKDVRQPHERDELEEVARRVPQPDTASVAAGGQLEPGESVDRDGVGLDSGHVADRDVGPGAVEQRADPFAQLLSGVPAILTTDLRSFWAKREVVLEYGLEVWRPSDALRAYIPRWNAQEEEFARRRAAASGRR
jgi:hypothetical protein